MLDFSPADPFPLLSEDSHTYSEAQAHSRLADEWLGLKTDLIESTVKSTDGQQTWAGLGISALMTPYTELRLILEKLKPQPGQTVIDLGAAYGRLAFVIEACFPGARFIGYELEQARVVEGRAAYAYNQLKLAELHQADLSSKKFTLESAEFYFIYDYGTRQAINKTLLDLRLISLTRKITVVGRGRSSRDAIERGHPWLSQVVTPEHFKHFSIYRSRAE
jgi:hypothetical protein